MSANGFDVWVCRVLWCVAVRRSVLQSSVVSCVVCCSVLQRVAGGELSQQTDSMSQSAGCYGVVWCVAVCCSALPCVAVCCSVR